jgi:hypothetical protein
LPGVLMPGWDVVTTLIEVLLEPCSLFLGPVLKIGIVRYSTRSNDYFEAGSISIQPEQPRRDRYHPAR